MLFSIILCGLYPKQMIKTEPEDELNLQQTFESDCDWFIKGAFTMLGFVIFDCQSSPLFGSESSFDRLRLPVF
jgi:hypothetical protein